MRVSCRIELAGHRHRLFTKLLVGFLAVAIGNLIFPLIHVELDIELIEPSQLLVKLFFLGKGFLNLDLGVLQLDLHVLQLGLCLLQEGVEAGEGVVDTDKVAEHVSTQGGRMRDSPFQGQAIFLGEALKEKLHLKAPVLPDDYGVGVGHRLAGVQDCSAGLFLVGIDRALDLHRAEIVFAGVGVILAGSNIGLVPSDALLQRGDLLGKILDNLVLQGVLLAQVAGLDELQLLDRHIQVHLLLDLRVSRAKGLDLSVRECGLVNVFRRPHRGFGGHNLADELLLALYQLIEIGIKGVLGDIGVDLHLRVFVALANDAPLPLLEVR